MKVKSIRFLVAGAFLGVLGTTYGYVPGRPAVGRHPAFGRNFEYDQEDNFFGGVRESWQRMQESMWQLEDELAQTFGSFDTGIKTPSATAALTATKGEDSVVITSMIDLDDQTVRQMRGTLSNANKTLTVSLNGGQLTMNLRQMFGGMQLGYELKYEQKEIREEYDGERGRPAKVMRRPSRFKRRSQVDERQDMRHPRAKVRRSMRQEAHAFSSGYLKVPGSLALDKAKIEYNKKTKQLTVTIPRVLVESEGAVIVPEIKG